MEQPQAVAAKAAAPNPRVDSLNNIHDVMHRKLLRQFRVNLFYKNTLRFPQWELQAHEIEVLRKSFVEEVDADLRAYRTLLFEKFHLTERLNELPAKLVRVNGPAWRPSGSAKQDFRARSISLKHEYLKQLNAAVTEAEEELKQAEAERASALTSLSKQLSQLEEERAALDRIALEAENVAAACESRRDEVINAVRKRDLAEAVRLFDETDFRSIQM